LITSTAALGCFFHTGIVQVAPPARSDGGTPDRLSEENIRVVLEVVDRIALDEGFLVERRGNRLFGPEVLAYYASPEQISLAVKLSKKSRSISIQIRDVNNTRETDYTRRIRSAIEDGIHERLPDLRLSYETARDR